MPAEAKRYTSCCGLEYHIPNNTESEDDQHPSTEPFAKDEPSTKSELLVQEAQRDLLTSILAQQEKQTAQQEQQTAYQERQTKALEVLVNVVQGVRNDLVDIRNRIR